MAINIFHIRVLFKLSLFYLSYTKIHSLEQRRKVTGRSRPLSELITEYKKNKKLRKFAKTAGNQPNTVPLMSPSHIPTSSNHIPMSPTSPFTPLSPKHEPPYSIRIGSPPHPSIMGYFDDVEVERFEDESAPDKMMTEATPAIDHNLSEDQLYPKPAAVS